MLARLPDPHRARNRLFRRFYVCVYLLTGGPGATGRSYSDFPTIIESIRDRLLSLPGDSVVLTGHGDTTTIADEAPHLQEWLDRGH